MKGWKTVLVNGLTALVGVATTVLADAPIDPKTLGIILAALGGVNLVLRSLTTTPIGQSS